jgi:hypothetical protein
MDDRPWREIASMTDQELRQEMDRLQAAFDQGGGKDTRLGEKARYFWALVESRKLARKMEQGGAK